MKRKLTVNWQLATVESRLGVNCQRDKCYRAAQVDIHNTRTLVNGYSLVYSFTYYNLKWHLEPNWR